MSNYEFLRDKSILITGGTGSLGRQLAKILLTEANPLKVIVFSRDEWKQSEMRASEPLFNHKAMRYFLGDVRDPQRLVRAFNEVDYVIHAAALKQVPAAEYNPTEFVRTNIDGAVNVINAAIDCRVRAVMALSTDKAVNPVNLYGATKLCSDKLFVAGNSYVGRQMEPKLSVVRYGNVLGSRGSIIPLWQKMVADGATSLPITDMRMTRFWISIEQAAHFVLNCFKYLVGGEIFVPKIPSMRIVDLAQTIAPKLPHDIIGVRPGEKLHEVMITPENAPNTLDCGDYYAILPATRANDNEYIKRFQKGKETQWVPEGFNYASNTNDKWLNVESLRKLIH
ncbi:MAG: UDP-N-acetylglucosamine 4,6-dehydratase (inverting) [Parachlamydiales bacterium]|jgi:UDP-N-acetylglucosamine 4,6-dehydratase